MHATLLRASGKSDLACEPIDFWIVLLEPRESEYKINFSKIADLESDILFVPFMGHW